MGIMSIVNITIGALGLIVTIVALLLKLKTRRTEQ